MKRLFGTLVCLVMWNVCFAGPFGLSMGMTLEEVTEACGGREPVRLENDDRYLIVPEKRHSMFEHYAVRIDDAQGLITSGPSVVIFSLPATARKSGPLSQL